MSRVLFLTLMFWVCLLAAPERADATVMDYNSCKAYLTSLEAPASGLEECVAFYNTSGAIGWGFFSGAFCVIRSAMTKAMFEMYCSLMQEVEKPLTIALGLYIIFYGIALIFGIGDDSGKKPGPDFLVRLLKIVVILMIALQPEIFYFYLYRLIVYGLLGGLAEMLISVSGYMTSGGGVAPTTTDPIMFVFSKLDVMWDQTVGTPGAGLMVLAVALLMLGIGTSLAFMIISMVIMMIMAFLRAVAAFATSIISLSFILMFTPLFVIFLMFRTTKALFDGWLSSVITFTIQPIIILFFLFLWGELLDFKVVMAGAATSGDTLITAMRSIMDTMGISTGEYSTKSGFINLSMSAPKFIGLTGEPGEIGVTSVIAGIVNITFYIIALFVMNAAMVGFVKQVPLIANSISLYSGRTLAPYVSGGGASGMKSGIDVAQAALGFGQNDKERKENAGTVGVAMQDYFADKLAGTKRASPKLATAETNESPKNRKPTYNEVAAAADKRFKEESLKHIEKYGVPGAEPPPIPLAEGPATPFVFNKDAPPANRSSSSPTKEVDLGGDPNSPTFKLKED